MKVEPSGMESVNGDDTRYHLRIWRLIDKHFAECPVCYSVVAMDSLVTHGMAAHGKIFKEPYLTGKEF